MDADVFHLEQVRNTEDRMPIFQVPFFGEAVILRHPELNMDKNSDIYDDKHTHKGYTYARILSKSIADRFD